VLGEGPRSGGGQGHTLLARLDFPGDAHDHGCTSPPIVGLGDPAPATAGAKQPLDGR
jgi:hypothetical protein